MISSCDPGVTGAEGRVRERVELSAGPPGRNSMLHTVHRGNLPVTMDVQVKGTSLVPWRAQDKDCDSGVKGEAGGHPHR